MGIGEPAKEAERTVEKTIGGGSEGLTESLGIYCVFPPP